MRLRDRLPSYVDLTAYGLYNAPCDYIIYKSGANTKILNVNTGVVDYTEANPDVAINAAIGAVTYGAHFYVKPGVYTLAAPVVAGRKCIRFDGAGIGYGDSMPTTGPIVHFRPAPAFGANWLFDFGAGGGHCWGPGMSNMVIDGRQYADVLGGIKLSNTLRGLFDCLCVKDFRSQAPLGTGILLTNDGAHNTNWNIFSRIQTMNNTQGIQIDTLCNCNLFMNCEFNSGLAWATYGVNHVASTTNAFLDCELIGHDSAGSIGLWIQGGGLLKCFGLRFESNETDIQMEAAVTYASYFFGTNHSVAAATSVIDGAAATKKSQFYGSRNWVTRRRGITAVVADGGSFDHDLCATPEGAIVTPSVASEFVSVTALDANHITVAIKKDTGAAGTAQILYWEAWTTGATI